MHPETTKPFLVVDGAPGVALASGYTFTWLQYVTGFRADRHCLECLRGTKSRLVTSKGIPLGTPIELSEARADYLYLCGVSKAYMQARRYGRGNEAEGYARNLHLAARPAPGKLARVVDWQGQTFTLHNAEAVEIPPVADGFGGLPADTTRCRNWQFGHAYYPTAAELVP